MRRHFLWIWLPVFLIQVAGNASLCAATFSVTNAADSGLGTFRAAISNANFVAGADLIHFAIPGSGPRTISLASALPALVEPVTVDGTTQPGYAGLPLIELDGLLAGSSSSGLYVLTSGAVIRGLSFSRFAREAIRIEADGNSVQGNFIGTGPFGTNLLGNGNGAVGVAGITLLGAGNRVGGTSAAERNVISGGNRHGIFLLTEAAVSNVIQGNFIGTDLTGMKRLGNSNNGIALAAGARGNLIGGTNNAERNVISGNQQSGVFLLDNATAGNVIQGNHIGTDLTGTLTLSNASDGITISGAVGNLIGGTNAGARNVISGNIGRGVLIGGVGARNNLLHGNYLGTTASGGTALANRLSGVELFNVSSNRVGGIEPGARNLISGNGLSGVSITDSNATGNQVLGNFIGTDASGSNALANSRSGVFISGVVSNFIGGSETGARNVIAGNAENGVLITDARARGNWVAGNFIGTDLNGNRRLANGFTGVRLESPANFIGGTSPGARNVISGNGGSGLLLYLAAASNNVIQGNFIGTTATGAAALSNSFAGIGLTNASVNLLGGTNAGAGNVISGNHLNGIYLLGRANANVIQGNHLGTDAAGTNGLPNGAGLFLGSYGGAIDIAGAAGTVIGGSVPGAGNLISANWRSAIVIGDIGATNTVIKGNRLGVKADGVTALGNDRHGIEIRAEGGGANTTIGGPEPGAGNIIANAVFSQYSGVRVRPHPSNTNILVRGNSIYFNGGNGATGLGIDLENFDITANDNCDGDGGANRQQNFPVLTNAQSAGAVTVVSGTLNSAANTTYLLQFFANPVPEPSGRVEGKVYLGEGTVTTGVGCIGAFTVRLTNGVPAGQHLTATATDPANNTSEFSTNLVVVAAQLPGFTLQPTNQTALPGGSVGFNAVVTGTPPLTFQWRFNGTNLAGATTTSLGLSSLQLSHAGNYSIVASNTFGVSSSTNALLKVITNGPALTTAGGQGALTLEWPADGTPYRLLAATNLSPPVTWAVATNLPVQTNGQYRVVLPPVGAHRFFRLVFP